MIAKNTERETKGMTIASGLLLADSWPRACCRWPPAHAATFTVDRNDDPVPTTAEACTDTLNNCSLRGAIVAVNAAAGYDALRASVVSRLDKGRLDSKPNGVFSYEPKRNFNGPVRFVYGAGDGRGGTDTATVSIRIKARPG